MKVVYIVDGERRAITIRKFLFKTCKFKSHVIFLLIPYNYVHVYMLYAYNIVTYIDLVILCLHILVRLVNGSTQYEGRVEVYYNGVWGTVCDDGWDFNDAQVVCRQLGYGPPITTRYRAYYGQGSGQYSLYNLYCYGGEFSIRGCFHVELGMYDCEHNRDAGVECYPKNGNYIV